MKDGALSQFLLSSQGLTLERIGEMKYKNVLKSESENLSLNPVFGIGQINILGAVTWPICAAFRRIFVEHLGAGRHLVPAWDCPSPAFTTRELCFDLSYLSLLIDVSIGEQLIYSIWFMYQRWLGCFCSVSKYHSFCIGGPAQWSNDSLAWYLLDLVHLGSVSHGKHSNKETY